MIAAKTLGIALGISILANIVTGMMLKGAWQDLATAKERGEQAVKSAEACSAGTEALVKAAEERARKAAEEDKLVRERVKSLEGRAQRTMVLSPSRPDDLCASDVILSREWIKQRREGKQ